MDLTVTKRRVLFVDDEPTIRVTLALILRNEGFDVTVADTVSAALQTIQNNEFDILLSDLNIGQPGDGFTVVSAMRRVQPRARTFIITGYPDFETALIAIRNQVDDYFTKPADIKTLVQRFKEAVAAPSSAGALAVRRISTIIREYREQVIDEWLAHCMANPELSSISLTRHERLNHFPSVLLEIAERIERHPQTTSKWVIDAAMKHGIIRQEQGYTIPMLLVESSILEKTLAELLQSHLLSIDISTLIPDIHQMSEALNCVAETAVRAFLDSISMVKAM